MRIQQLEIQLGQAQSLAQHRQDNIDGLTQGLAHVVDVIVAELAKPDLDRERRAELAAVAKNIREQFVGAAPAGITS